MKPDKINILGKEYKIIYVDNPSEVDIYKRQSLWGQIDYWTLTIRIFDNNRSIEDIWHSLIHEILHGISSSLKLKLNNNDNHDELDILSLALTDVLFRNDLIKR